MFGYLFPTKEVLTRENNRIFRDYYCTLCLSHRYRYGLVSTLLNNYDVGIFYIILKDYGDEIEDCRYCGRYIPNRRAKFSENQWGNIVDYNINLIRTKIEDDLHDYPDVTAIASSLATRGIFAQSRKNNPALFEIFDEEFDHFLKIESRKPEVLEILDAYEIFANHTFGALNGIQPERLALFTSLNRWIYWIDAVNDYDDDLKSGSYNCFVHYYRSMNKAQFLENHMLQLIEEYEGLKQSIDTAFLRCKYPRENSIILLNIIHQTIKKTTKLILENGSIPKRRKLL